MEDNKLWQELLNYLNGKINEQNINIWLKPLKIKELRGDLITLTAPNKFIKNWVEEKYLDLLTKTFNEFLSIDVKEIKIELHKKENQNKSATTQTYNSTSNTNENIFHTNLNKDYTFDSFVEGSSNEFASSAARAVADGNFNIYNPLFIYGGVGLGKTHLMHATGNKLLENFPKLKVLYISSENWTNELIQSMRIKKMENFKQKYRSIDVLLFDDVQFIAGKQRTTEEFFHTFNSLYDMQKQIIITSDKTPDEMPEMEERLTSRFVWGLIADIQPPSAEEKIAILMKRAENLKIDLPNEVAMFIAENIKKENVRDLLGAFTRLTAYASFNNEPLSIELAEKTLERFLKQQNKILTADTIINTVSNFFNVKPTELKSKKRTKSISYPRQITMYLLREKLNISLKEIGEIFSGRDHSTVLHSIQGIEEKIKIDNELKDTINIIQKKLYE